MLGLRFFKGLPTDYVIKYVNGQPVAEGVGIAFKYLRHNTQIVVIPISSKDGDVTFSSVTCDLQTIAVHIQFTYRIADPHQAASQFNFSVDTSRQHRYYVSRDSAKMTQRVANVIQSEATAQLQQIAIDEVIYELSDIAQAAQENVNNTPMLHTLGVEVVNVFFVSVRQQSDGEIAPIAKLSAFPSPPPQNDSDPSDHDAAFDDANLKDSSKDALHGAPAKLDTGGERDAVSPTPQNPTKGVAAKDVVQNGTAFHGTALYDTALRGTRSSHNKDTTTSFGKRAADRSVAGKMRRRRAVDRVLELNAAREEPVHDESAAQSESAARMENTTRGEGGVRVDVAVRVALDNEEHEADFSTNLPQNASEAIGTKAEADNEASHNEAFEKEAPEQKSIKSSISGDAREPASRAAKAGAEKVGENAPVSMDDRKLVFTQALFAPPARADGMAPDILSIKGFRSLKLQGDNAVSSNQHVDGAYLFVSPAAAQEAKLQAAKNRRRANASNGTNLKQALNGEVSNASASKDDASNGAPSNGATEPQNHETKLPASSESSTRND